MYSVMGSSGMTDPSGGGYVAAELIRVSQTNGGTVVILLAEVTGSPRLVGALSCLVSAKDYGGVIGLC